MRVLFSRRQYNADAVKKWTASNSRDDSAHVVSPAEHSTLHQAKLDCLPLYLACFGISAGLSVCRLKLLAYRAALGLWLLMELALVARSCWTTCRTKYTRFRLATLLDDDVCRDNGESWQGLC